MQEQRQLFGHPIGLSILFFTELWERFSFYGMRAILVLYLTAESISENPGMGFDNAKALSWYGTYTALVYIASIPGGIIADKLLGQKISVLLGGILIIIGQFSLTAESTTMFIVGLAFIISGVGMLKPNISTMVGGLYKTGDARRDAGFTLFYMGINIGAFSAPLLVGYIGEVYNWKWAFSLAGFGMVIGQIVYVFGWKYLKGVGNLITKNRATAHLAKTPLTKIEKDRMVVLFISFLIVLVFWAAYEQAGGLMNLFAKESVDRVIFGWEIPASFFQSLHAGYVIILAIPMALFWDRWRRRGFESSSPFKMAVGSIIMSLGFVALMGAVMQLGGSSLAKASMGWLFLSYGLHVVAELSISPVALSFITKLAPAKYASIMMGLYFGVTGIGNKVAGLLGEAAQEAGEMAIFTGIAIFCLILGLLVFFLVKKLKALAHGAEDVSEQPVVVEPE